MAKTLDILTDCTDLASRAFPAKGGTCSARDAGIYLAHTERGQSMRALAGATGAHPSTVSRTVARVEARRDDPLIDGLLADLGDRSEDVANHNTSPADCPIPDGEDEVEREAKRFLRRLSEPGSVLVIAPGTDKGGIFCSANGHAKPIAMLPVRLAAEFLRRDWIKLTVRGASTLRYHITEPGRAWLRRTLAEAAATRAPGGFAEAPTAFAHQHQLDATRIVVDPDTGVPEVLRVNLGESPLGWLARRVGADGKAFLSADELEAGERLRMDFELAQIGPSVAQDWRKFMTPHDKLSGTPRNHGPASGPMGARDRVTKALDILGPGLSDVAVRVCCFLEGLEACERRMGWSARSGKVVLKIALQRLSDHYGLTAFRK